MENTQDRASAAVRSDQATPVPAWPKTTRGRGLWNVLRDRHSDGTKHRWAESQEPLGLHACGGLGYCHHYLVECGDCGARRQAGYFVEEVR